MKGPAVAKSLKHQWDQKQRVKHASNNQLAVPSDDGPSGGAGCSRLTEAIPGPGTVPD